MRDDVHSRILPVLDLKNGHVVRGVGGRRDEYLPVVSTLTSSTKPADVAVALHERFGYREFYLADLGAICDRRPHWSEIDALADRGLQLNVDSGIRGLDDCEALLQRSGMRAVIGLETLAQPRTLRDVVRAVDAERLVFSLDLLNGRPIAADGQWPADAIGVAEIAIETGLRTIIVLDLAAVGTGGGCPTLALCRLLRARWPQLEIITGGGIRSRADVHEAVAAGVDQVLVASALHDGRID